MCGIFGYFDSKRRYSIDQATAALNTLKLRGPDHGDLKQFEDGRLVLGHRRLAVIDLDARSDQPFSCAEAGLEMVYNGEVYNYKALRDTLLEKGHSFSTSSDTEVILAAYKEYGEDCVDYFEGMFAFVIYDKARCSLFAARDHAGQKPLYYYLSENFFGFGSELKSLLALPGLPRRLSMSGLNSYLTYGYVNAPDCILDGYAKLPPGHCATYKIETGQLDVRAYWTPPEYDHSKAEPEELLMEFEALFDQTVKQQMVSDVPIAVLLSGGLDSSLVAAFAARHSKRLQTYTVVFPGDKKLDESPFARQVANSIGAEHTEIEGQTPSLDTFEQLSRAFCEPIADNSIVPTYLVSCAVRQSATVALGGDGGDELFAGYPHHRRVLKLSKIRQFVPPGVSTLCRLIPEGIRGANAARSLLDKRAPTVFFNRYMGYDARRSVLREDICDEITRDAEQQRQTFWDSEDGSVIQKATRTDFNFYLPDNILAKVDRSAMAASLETRAPFLDRAVVDFAFRRVGDQFKTDGTRGKILLQDLARKVLPDDFDSERKQGFSAPVSTWLSQHWSGLIGDLVGKDSIFRPEAVEKIIASRSDNNPMQGRRLFQLVILHHWMQAYQITL